MKNKLTPEQKALADQLKFTMEMHMNCEDHGHLQHGCTYKGLKLTRIVYTPKIDGVWGNGELIYLIDGDKNEYKSGIEFLNAILAKTEGTDYVMHNKTGKKK